MKLTKSMAFILVVYFILLLPCSVVFAAVTPINDFGMTSDAHAKHVGNIVFSKSPIKFKAENESAFTDTFMYPNETPYFMAYFPKSIANRCIEEHGVRPGIANAAITFTFYVQGEKAGTIEQQINQPQLETWTGWSDPKTPLGKTKGMLPKYCLLFRDEVLTRLKKGKNKIRMEFGYKVVADNAVLENKAPLTAGTFTVVMAGDWEKKLDAAPKGVKKDPKLERRIRDALNKRWGKSHDTLRVILMEKDWRVEVNSLTGIPVRKVLQVYAITRLKSGECMAYPYQVKREYLGEGKYSDEILWYSSGGRSSYEVKCE